MTQMIPAFKEHAAKCRRQKYTQQLDNTEKEIPGSIEARVSSPVKVGINTHGGTRKAPWRR